MADFTVRVELHGATGVDYENLHEAMFQAGFRRFIVGDGGGVYALPTAEYRLEDAPMTAEGVRELGLAVARRVRASPDPWVLACETTNVAWSTKRIVVPDPGRRVRLANALTTSRG